MKLPKQKGSAYQQAGHALILIILAVVILVVGGIYFYQTRKGSNLPQIPSGVALKKSESQDYSNQTLGFSFKYSNGLTVKADTEEEFNKRAGGNFRKNFRGYVGYEPGKFLGAVVVLDKYASFDTNPLTVWVFNNDDNLTIDTWYQQYWYYPFVWGDFTYTGKFTLAPKQDATVSGQIGKSGVIDYSAGKPKFIYLLSDKRMYLFRVIGETGDKILSTFKFLNQENKRSQLDVPQ